MEILQIIILSTTMIGANGIITEDAAGGILRRLIMRRQSCILRNQVQTQPQNQPQSPLLNTNETSDEDSILSRLRSRLEEPDSLQVLTSSPADYDESVIEAQPVYELKTTTTLIDNIRKSLKEKLERS